MPPPPLSVAAQQPGPAPQMLIIGAQKAATTSIFELLRDAKLVCGRGPLPPTDLHVKEAHFFDQLESQFNSSTLEDYQKGYRTAGCSRYVDATPNYLFNPGTAERMVRLMPDAWTATVRILAILREPIARDLSVYNMMKSLWWGDAAAKKSGQTGLGSIEYVMCEYADGRFPSYKQATACMLDDWHSNCVPKGQGDFRKAYAQCSSQIGPPWRHSNRLANGMYWPQVGEFVAAFGRSHLLVLNFADLVRAPADQIGRLLAFAGLPKQPQLRALPADNTMPFPGKVERIDCETRDAVWNLFEPSNQGLYALLSASPKAIPSHEPPFSEFSRPPCEVAELEYNEAAELGRSRQGKASAKALHP